MGEKLALVSDYKFRITAWKGIRYFLLLALAAFLVSLQADGMLDLVVKDPRLLSTLLLAAVLEAVRNLAKNVQLLEDDEPGEPGPPVEGQGSPPPHEWSHDTY